MYGHSNLVFAKYPCNLFSTLTFFAADYSISAIIHASCSVSSMKLVVRNRNPLKMLAKKAKLPKSCKQLVKNFI